MKKTTIKASLMLEDTLKAPLMQDEIEITLKDFKKGIEHVYDKCQLAILSRLTVVIDEEKLKKVFG